jgi:hypothetical protein
MSWCVKPLMYGYLRITELADDEVQQLECALEKLAEAEGFCLTEMEDRVSTSACRTR